MLQIVNKVYCGNLTDIPSKLPKLSSEVFTLIEIAVPVLLIIMGTLDLFKGITANKEDEIAKGRKLFVKRLITGVLVFFIFIITKFVVSLIDNNNYTSITSCMDCFISGKCGIPCEFDKYILVINNGKVSFKHGEPYSYFEISNGDFKPGLTCPDPNEYRLKSEQCQSGTCYSLVAK